MVKNLPAMQETWVRFLGWEDLLEEGMVQERLKQTQFRCLVLAGRKFSLLSVLGQNSFF